ncbi:F0F1 ATP synthase subunit B [Candidatus Saccharibacteria bacterium]|nr:MAG: F0F1 ATP synthase subunit B [Candidatus Saccharibacteria bacterium]
MNILTTFASTTEAPEESVVTALGIDGTLLIFQIVAFGLLTFALGKWVYPVFIRTIDKRQAMIEESTRAAVEAEKNAAKTQAKIDKLLTEARVEAREIVATAKDEASSMVADAETKGKQQAEHIVTMARESLAKDVIAAKKALHNETIELVALATQKVVTGAITPAIDEKVIAKALEATK